MEEISQLWIIDREAGICIFDQNFRALPKDVNPDLISGFFIALITFAQEMADQDIKFIQLKGMRIYFENYRNFVFAVASIPPHDDFDRTQKTVKKIQVKFEDRYSLILDKGYFGQTSLFEDFATDVEGVVGTESLALDFLREKTEQVKIHVETAKKEFNILKLLFLERSGLVVPEGDLSVSSIIKTQFQSAKEIVPELLKEKIQLAKRNTLDTINKLKIKGKPKSDQSQISDHNKEEKSD